MLFSTVTALVPIIFAGSALGHGQVRYFITSTNTYPAADAYASSPDPSSPIRKLDTYGSAAPFTGSAITCGSGGNNAAAVVAPVAAGSSVTFDWGTWTSSHPGPVMTYIASCPSGCASFKGDSGAVWVKIQQDGCWYFRGAARSEAHYCFDPDNPNRSPAWAEQILEQQGSSGHAKWTVQIPSTLPNGEYLLRHEILGLHVAYLLNGAQFYPNCVQIKITGGGGTALPSGIALPGAYQPTDPGIYLQLYWITPTNNTYVIPGGPVRYGSGATGTAPNPASSTSTKLPASSTTSKTSSTSAGSTGGVAKYGQCGGTGWTGGTVCVAGATCTVLNAYYSQCL